MFTKFKFLIFLLVIFTVASCTKSSKGIFIKSAEEGNIEKMLYLMKKGVQIDTKDGLGYTALMKAASSGEEEVVKFLLGHGANVNTTTVFGTTALMQAAWGGHLEIVKILVDNQADIKIRGAGGWNVLFFAALSDQACPEIMEYLLERGIDPNTKDNIGFTVLLWINNSKPKPEIVSILYKYGVKE